MEMGVDDRRHHAVSLCLGFPLSLDNHI
jgi:hypothetical protein